MVQHRWLAVVLLTICVGCSEETPKAPPSGTSSSGEASRESTDPTTEEEKPRQDSPAWALFDRADQILYMPALAGLKDLTYQYRLSDTPGIHFVVRWVAPEHTDVRIEVEDDSQRSVANSRGQQLMSRALEICNLVVGRSHRDLYKDDDVTLSGAEAVEVVARSEESRARFSRSVTRFYGNGLPVSSTQTLGDGREFTVDMTFMPGPDGRYLVSRMDATEKGTDGSTRQTAMEFSYVELGGFVLLSKIDGTSEGNSIAQTFDNHRVDQGLRVSDIR